MPEFITNLAKNYQNGAEPQTALAGVIARIRESVNLDTIFKTTVIEVRQLLQADRVAVLRLSSKPKRQGKFIAEDVAASWDTVLNTGASAAIEVGSQFAM
jgi:GAF domain-containing protein